MGGAVALEVILHHQAFRTGRQILGFLVQQIIGDRLAQQVAEPFHHRAGGNLPTFNRVLTWHNGIGVGTKDSFGMQWFCTLAQIKVR